MGPSGNIVCAHVLRVNLFQAADMFKSYSITTNERDVSPFFCLVLLSICPPKLLCYSLQCYDLTWYLLLVIDSTVLFLRVFFVLSASFAVLKTFIFAAMCNFHRFLYMLLLTLKLHRNE